MLKNLKINAIICEFNPLHLGHKYILDKCSNKSAVICVMSGNFVQRGDFAISDKWTRTKMALECGADLVIELPLPFATANAETFAFGAVEILNSLGIVDNLYFGSECGNADTLSKIAKITKTDEFSNLLKNELKRGITFAKARENTVADIMGTDYHGELSKSNNNLGIEYINALTRLNSSINPCTVTRLGAEHDTMSDAPVVSAMQIRDMLRNNDDSFNEKMPEICTELLCKNIENKTSPVNMENLELAILSKLRTLSPKKISSLPDISEGLDNKFYKSIRTARSLDELISLTKSKRYTEARIRRLILHAFLGVKESSQKNAYIRILGMNETGKEIIKKANKTLPILGKSSDINKMNSTAKKLFKLECSADDIYALAMPKPDVCGSNMSTKMIIK